jgi:regulator of replication initiation timing
MTENLLQKLEERMMGLLTEVEELRKQVKHTNNENAALKLDLQKRDVEANNHEKKLQDLISLLDAVSEVEKAIPMSTGEVVSIHG